MSDSGPIQAESGRRKEALLAAYAAGTLSEPLAVLVASHLQMRADNWADGEQLRQPMSGMEQMDALMPPALHSYVGRHLGLLEWRTILPGLEQCQIACDALGDARFLRCRPGRAIPTHTHGGLEAVLVLRGGFRDTTGHYAQGDIAVADHTIRHRPVADRAAECIIFIVLEAPVKLTGPFGRLVQRIVGT